MEHFSGLQNESLMENRSEGRSRGAEPGSLSPLSGGGASSQPLKAHTIRALLSRSTSKKNHMDRGAAGMVVSEGRLFVVVAPKRPNKLTEVSFGLQVSAAAAAEASVPHFGEGHPSLL